MRKRLNTLSLLYLRLAVPFFILFALPAVLIRAQPYNDPDLSRLLGSPDCQTPCFMGIRPGVTTVMEAVQILRGHPWVGDVQASYTAPGTSAHHVVGAVYWDWKPDAPVWFRVRSTVAQHDGSLDTLDGIVQDISVPTNIPFGRLWLARGSASDYDLAFNLVVTTQGAVASALMRYQNDDLQNDVEMDTHTLCQASWNAWFQPGLMTVLNTPSPDTRFAALNNDPLLSEIHSLRVHVCAGG